MSTAKATTAREWADDITTMLTTYSRNPADVVAFAQEHGAIAGHWVAATDGWAAIKAENGWTAHYDGTRFIAV